MEFFGAAADRVRIAMMMVRKEENHQSIIYGTVGLIRNIECKTSLRYNVYTRNYYYSPTLLQEIYGI